VKLTKIKGLIECFMMGRMLSVGESQAGQCSSWSPLLLSHAVVIDAVCGLALSPLYWEHILLLNLYIPFTLMDRWKFYGTNTSPLELQPFEPSADNKPESPSFSFYLLVQRT